MSLSEMYTVATSIPNYLLAILQLLTEKYIKLTLRWKS
jgi:hypothetical protein